MYSSYLYGALVAQSMTQKTTEEKALVLETLRNVRHAAGEALLDWIESTDDLEYVEETLPCEDFVRGYNQARSDAAQFALRRVLNHDPFDDDDEDPGCDCK